MSKTKRFQSDCFEEKPNPAISTAGKIETDPVQKSGSVPGSQGPEPKPAEKTGSVPGSQAPEPKVAPEQTPQQPPAPGLDEQKHQAAQKTGSGSQAPEPKPTPEQTPQQPPAPGLDEQKHRAAQRAADQADKIITGYLPMNMATGLNMGSDVDNQSYRTLLDRILQDKGNPTDPFQRMLMEQLVFLNLRLSDLQAQAAATKSLEGIRLLNGVCCRLFAEIRRCMPLLSTAGEKKKSTPRVRLAQTG